MMRTVKKSRSRQLDLSAAIGEGLARFRHDRGLRQEDFATSAREIGLKWTRATIAAVETGRRSLTAEEMLLLRQVIYGASGQAPASVVDLIADDVKIVVAEGVAVAPSSLDGLWRGEGADDSAPLSEKPTGIDAVNVAIGDAEQRAALKLGVDPYDLAGKCIELWGHSLSAERDERVAWMLSGEWEGAQPPTLQALRGHATRLMLERLREAFGLAPEMEDLPFRVVRVDKTKQTESERA
jgi:transcriptional regulator with XRE-family HTH domain